MNTCFNNGCKFELTVTENRDVIEKCSICGTEYFHKFENIKHVDLRKTDNGESSYQENF